MAEVTKEDVLDAFKNNSRKRRILLYHFYKSNLFDQDFSAAYIAKKISEDLGMEIRLDMIYNLNKYIKKSTNTPPSIEQTEDTKRSVLPPIIDSLSKADAIIKNIPNDKDAPVTEKKNNSKF